MIPSCLGGTNENSNLVALYPEEHFLAHVLLVKIYPEYRNLIFAVQRMCAGNKRKNRKMYGWLKRRFAEEQSRRMSGEGNPNFGTHWVNDGSSSKKLSKDAPLPDGWFFGRVKKEVQQSESLCVVCYSGTGSMRRRFCDSHKPKPLGTKGMRYTGKSKATDEDVLAALVLTDFDVPKAMSHLGYNPKGYGNSRNRFKAIAASVV